MITAPEGLDLSFLVKGFYELCNFCGFILRQQFLAYDRRQMDTLCQSFYHYGGLDLLDDLACLDIFLELVISVGYFLVC